MEQEKVTYRSHFELPAIVNSKNLADFIQMSEPVARQMMRSEGFPLIKNKFVGTRRLAPKGPLIIWLRENGWLK